MITFNVTLEQAAELTGIPAATLAGLRDGSLVAVPREPTEAFIAAIRYAKKRGMLAEGIYAAIVLAAEQEPGHD